MILIFKIKYFRFLNNPIRSTEGKLGPEPRRYVQGKDVLNLQSGFGESILEFVLKGIWESESIFYHFLKNLKIK